VLCPSNFGFPCAFSLGSASAALGSQAVSFGSTPATVSSLVFVFLCYTISFVFPSLFL
jgi:hypothetical protein